MARAFADPRWIGALVGAAIVLAGDKTAQSEDWFVDGAAERGLKAVHHSGATGELYFPEIMCGGAAWLDYDDDGDLDLYLVQAHQLPKPNANDVGNQLFRNERGRFTEVPGAGGADDRGYGNGVSCGDYDNDGDVDIYVNNFGPNTLYRNNGDGTFTNVTAKAGVGDPRWTVSSTFVDYDADGDLDLYVVNYIRWSVETRHPCFGQGGRRDYCGPQSYNRPARDTLYRNNGDGTFADVTQQAGIAAARGNGLGVVTADFDGDGRTDIYVSNDGSENHIWMNRGNGTFVDDALLMGCAVNEMGQTEAGMGVTAADYDDDGDWDLFMVHLSGETNTFYEFDQGMYEDVTTRLGLATPSVRYTGMTAGFLDFDNDSRQDVFVTNGRVTYAAVVGPGGPFAEPDQLFRLTPERKFVDVSKQAGAALQVSSPTRGAAFGDFDNDGDVDFCLVGMDVPVRLVENRIGQKNHWIGVKTRDGHGRHALGAVVTVVTDRVPRNRLVQRGYGYAVSNDPRVLVGLGDSTTVKDVVIRWPGGTAEHFGPQQSDRYVELVQGKGRLAAKTKGK